VDFGLSLLWYKYSNCCCCRFGPLDLLEDPSAPLLLEQQHHSISWTSSAQQLLQQRLSDASFQQAADAALAAARAVS